MPYNDKIEISYRMSWRRSFSSSYYCDSHTIAHNHLIGAGYLYNKQSSANICSLTFYCTDYSVQEDWTTGVNKFYYDTSTTSLTSFDMYFSSCCWISINNGGGSWSLEASVDLTRRSDTGLINSSPITAMTPIIRVQYGCNYNLHIPTSDPDGDEVRCRWPISNYEKGDVITPTGISLNQKACTLSFNSNSLGYGWIGVAIVLEDFSSSSSTTPLSKIPLQFLINVRSSSGACSSRPNIVDPSPKDGDIRYIWYDDTFTVMIRAKGGSQNAYITEIDTVSPQGMTKSHVQPVFNSPSEFYSIISWVPKASQQGPHIFCFNAVDVNGQTSDQRCVTLVVCAFGPIFDGRTSYPGTGEVIQNLPDIWEIGFDNTFFLANETAHIRIYDTNDKEIYSLDTATSPYVIDGLKPGVVSFITPDLIVTDDHGEYYVLLDEGVVIGTDECTADSPAVKDPHAWRFMYTCNTTFTSPGKVKSLNHPANYPNDVICSILIIAGHGQKVCLSFKAFELESAYAETTTDQPSAYMTCTGNTMTVLVSRSIIGDVRADNLHFLDPKCRGTDHNSTHVRLETPFDKCGTLMTVVDNYVEFSNIVIDDALPITPDKVITRDRDMEIPLKCHMDKEGLGSVSFDPDTSKIIFREEGYGMFSFQIQLYQDKQYRTPYPGSAYPVDVNLKDMLYFEAQASAEPGLELFVETCVATQTSNPKSTPQYYFLIDGCATDNTYQTYPTSDPAIQRFGLEAFAFVGTGKPVFAHCYLKLCNVTDPTSRCALGCLPSGNKRDVNKRETASGSKSYVMSRGPLNIIEDLPLSSDEEHGIDAVGHPSGLGILVGFIGFLTLCIMAAIGTVIKTSQMSPPSGYTRVPDEQ
ncbi:uncharacterized protein [Amphiura filiformis]|uniref:uncharacterized protein n=1 Tax=Amphiura filiformis TaxID=82378 RepID=UPI003B2252E9